MDNIVLNGPNGSSINVGSFLMYDPGADFGEQDLLKAVYAENPAAEGGVLAFETVNMRRMSFPMRLASVGAFSGINGLQGWLRQLARPGATLDVQLEGVASAEAVRFDVGAGRLELDYDHRQYGQLDRIPATLKLDVQPFGYWPTMILLASAASIGGPGVLSLNLGGSIFGDVPGLGEIFIAPTSATSFGASQGTDSVIWSLGARPSFRAHLAGGSLVYPITGGLVAAGSGGLVGDQFAPASQALRTWIWRASLTGITPGQVYGGGWQEGFEYVISPGLEPAYRGRFRAYGYLRWSIPTSAPFAPIPVTLDVQPGTGVQQALASSAQVGTVTPAQATSGSNDALSASPAYSIIDFGDISLPAVASVPFETKLRVWFYVPTTNLGYATTATAALDLGGLYLQPLEGGAGVLPRGLRQPTWTSGSSFTARFYDSAVPPVEVTIESPTSAVASRQAYLAGGAAHRGVAPLIGASTLQLDINFGGKQLKTGSPTNAAPIYSEPHFAQVSVRYRPRFSFMKGI